MDNKIAYKRLTLSLAILFSLAACSSSDNDDEPINNDSSEESSEDNTGSDNEDTGSTDAGSVSFTKLVTLGDSITAGYADGALYLNAQQNSYPAILARQLGIQDFTQGLVADDNGGIAGTGTGTDNVQEPRYALNASNVPERIDATPTTTLTPLGGSYQNIGVPGAKLIHVAAAGYGNIANLPDAANPYFVRIASDSNTSMIADATAQDGSFFVLWLGNNDLLSYGTSGGTGNNQTDNTDPTTYGANDITNPLVFQQLYNSIVTGLTANGAKGVVVTLPDVASLPYFTASAYNIIALTEQAQVDAANSAYATYNTGLQIALAADSITSEEATRRAITFSIGANPVVIEDENLTYLEESTSLPSIRQATAEDFVLLPAGAAIQAAAASSSDIPGLATALSDAQVLTHLEYQDLATARTAFNGYISSIAAANDGVTLFDAASVMAELAGEGYVINDSVTINADFITGGGFSLDAVHPTQRGYAVIANELIKHINSNYEKSFELVDPMDYLAVLADEE